MELYTELRNKTQTSFMHIRALHIQFSLDEISLKPLTKNKDLR
jgi:hypothetical protein